GAGRSCSGGPRAGGGLKRRRAISGKPSSPPSYPFFRRRFRCDWFLVIESIGTEPKSWNCFCSASLILGRKKKGKRNKVSPLPATPHGSGFRSLFSIHYRIHFLKASFWFLTKGT
uniref:Uncharacterized protein n=1 Tax=Oryza glaberrima TaxID=4538 RepID=I1QX31_ORYGL